MVFIKRNRKMSTLIKMKLLIKLIVIPVIVNCNGSFQREKNVFKSLKKHFIIMMNAYEKRFNLNQSLSAAN